MDIYILGYHVFINKQMKKLYHFGIFQAKDIGHICKRNLK